MSDPVYQVELIEVWLEGRFATVNLRATEYGWVSDWWISSNSGDDLRVVGHLELPIFGNTREDAERRCRIIADEVLDFVSWAGFGSGIVDGTVDVVRKAHCRKHLSEQKDKLGVMSTTAYTAVLYKCALQFGVSNPAAVIAGVEAMDSVRTIHERLAHARRLGLLDSPGKGSARKKPEKSNSSVAESVSKSDAEKGIKRDARGKRIMEDGWELI
jgi:hypothetical protein